MQAKIVTAALLGFVLIAAAACSGGDDGLSQAEEEALQQELAEQKKAAEEAEAARKKAEEEAKKAEEEAKKAEEEAKKAEEEAKKAEEEAEADRQAELEEARRKAEEAEQAAEQAQEEAARRIEEAEQQANMAVRAPLLIAELSGLTSGIAPDHADRATDAGVRHMPGASRTFTRPLNLPAVGSAPRVPGSWSSASYSGPRGNVGTDTVYLYTNIQAPSSKAFWKVHGESVTGLSGAASGLDETATVTSFGTDRSLYRDSDGNPESRDNVSRGGTYDGYSGTFKCTTGCNITAAADGALTFAGDWTFTASLSAKRHSSQAQQDTEFLYFGIWAYEPSEAATPPDFKWAAGGDTDDIADFSDLTGSATFTGGAIGKYALAKVAGRAAKVGTFTATANFGATFGDSPTISGRITDFKEDGISLGSDWHVFLGSSASAAATLAATGATGTTTTHGAIDGDTATGDWAATLHGSDNADMSAADDYTAAKYPRADVAGVAGWFNATTAGTNAAIAGAFGAACTTGTMCAK